jgi:hypothetical protein
VESLTTHARQLQTLLNTAMDIEAQFKLLANAVDFTPEDWQYMYANHRALANQLARIVDKYGPE